MSTLQNFELNSQEAVDQLREILDYYAENKLQIEIKTDILTTMHTFPSLRVTDHKRLMIIESLVDGSYIELHKENITKVKDAFYKEEISWRKASYEIQLNNDTTINIDVLN